MVLELLPALVIGGGVFLVGVGMLWTHVVLWRKYRLDPTLDERELDHYQKQFRRRMQTSGIIVLLGLLLGLATDRVPWAKAPAVAATYVIVLLALVFWIVLLALADYISNQAFARATLGKIRRKQEALEAELNQLRKRSPNGGDGTSRAPPGPQH